MLRFKFSHLIGITLWMLTLVGASQYVSAQSTENTANNTTSATTADTPVKSQKQLILDQLNAMVAATKNRDFENYFIMVEPVQVHSYRYRHAKVNHQQYAQLLNLDGAHQEVLQRDNLISYLGSNYQPFSLQGSEIVDGFPSVMFADFIRLSQYYDFVAMGRGRIADRAANVIKLLPKDDFRNQYVLWIDDESSLLLQSEMLDREGNLLQQYRVLALYLSEQLEGIAKALNKTELPPLLSMSNDKQNQTDFTWQTSWLPEGFTVTKDNGYQMTQRNVQSRIYSDGLFEFGIYVADNVDVALPSHFWNQGGNTIYTEVRDGKEITFIGQLPLVTAKRIVQDITFN